MKILTLLLIALVSTAEVRIKNSNRLLCEPSSMQQNTLLNGCLWVRSKKAENLKTIHAEVSSPQSDFFVHVLDKKIYYFNHSAILRLRLRDGRTLEVPQGFYVWISEIGMDKKNQMGVISPIEKSHIVQLARIWKGEPKELQSELGKYKMAWGSRIQVAANTYKGRVSRRIASMESLQQKKWDQQQEAKRERSKQQKMLFDRVFNR